MLGARCYMELGGARCYVLGGASASRANVQRCPCLRRPQARPLDDGSENLFEKPADKVALLWQKQWWRYTVYQLKSFPFQSIHAEQTMSWKSSNVSILNKVVNIIRKNVCCIHFFRKENHAILNIIINPTILTKTERRWQSLERQWRCRQQDAGSVHARSQASCALFKRNLIWNFPLKSTF